MKRKKMSKGSSKANFKKGMHEHVKNRKPMPMRGGYRF